jgi:hydroxyacylglutathione hydrolase
MYFEKIKTPGIAHVSYLIGDGGKAAVVDPRRDIEVYVARARANGLALEYVVETHRQEDFVIGSAALAKLTGAKIVTLDHALFGHSHRRLADGEEIAVGGLMLRALHTPGHTPESTSYAVFVGEARERALAVFSGDTLFVGETGRADLSDPKKTGEHAGQLYDAVRAKLLPLGDQTLLWPAHGAGSACGGNIADRDESTLGLERAYNPAFTNTRQTFIEAKMRERLPRPPYFTEMEVVNLRGGLPQGNGVNGVPAFDAKTFASEMKHGVVIDTRDPEAFAGGHIPGSINIWLEGLPALGGWIAKVSSRVLLVVRNMEDLGEAVMHLARIGVDGVAGTLAGGFEGWRNAGMTLAHSGTTDAASLARELATTTVLDVREDAEFEEAHIEDALHLYVGYIDEHLDRIESDLRKKPNLAITCSVGHRASVAVSLLERRGFRGVKNLLGGMTGWRRQGLPTVKGRERSVTTLAVP